MFAEVSIICKSIRQIVEVSALLLLVNNRKPTLSLVVYIIERATDEMYNLFFVQRKEGHCSKDSAVTTLQQGHCSKGTDDVTNIRGRHMNETNQIMMKNLVCE